MAIAILILLSTCQNTPEIPPNNLKHPSLTYQDYTAKPNDLVISRSEYQNKLYGFWLGQCIANWTGLVTEMDKIGNVGAIKTGDFYTRADWGQPDQPAIWGEGKPSDLSPTINFVMEEEGGIWGADDDTDIEYMYQHLLFTNQTSILTGEQIKAGWLKHIKAEEENYLWVSNQAALDLMREGVVPPETSNPEKEPSLRNDRRSAHYGNLWLFCSNSPRYCFKNGQTPYSNNRPGKCPMDFRVLCNHVCSWLRKRMPSKPIKKRIQWMAM